MKKVLFSFINTGVITILLHGNINAQQFALNKPVKTDHHLQIEKYDDAVLKLSAATNIDWQALKDFSKRFTSINNAAWHVADKGYIAEFSADSIKTTVAYGKKGKWIYTIQRYHEKKLPADIRARVKSVYYDYTILNICEVQVPQQENTIYILNLQYNQNIKTVRVCGDDMNVIADYHSYN